jgi:hypothetical protein
MRSSIWTLPFLECGGNTENPDPGCVTLNPEVAPKPGHFRIAHHTFLTAQSRCILFEPAAYLFGVTAGLLFLVGGRALHEFGKFDRMFGEMTSMVVAVVLGAVAVLLRGLAECIEAHDDGEPVRLAIGDGKENGETTEHH